MKQRPCRFSGRGAFPLPGRIPGAACGGGGHGAFAAGGALSGGGVRHGRSGGLLRLGGVGGRGGGHDGGARGRLLGDHAAGVVADVGGAAAAREQGGGQGQSQRKAQDLFHSNTSCQNADGGSLPRRSGDKRGNFYEKENF